MGFFSDRWDEMISRLDCGENIVKSMRYCELVAGKGFFRNDSLLELAIAHI